MSTSVFFLSATALAESRTKVGIKTGIFDGILNASPIVQLLLIVLLAISIISWAIIILKYRQYRRVTRANSEFNDRFWKAKSLEAAFEKANDFPHSNLARIFRAAFLELQRLADVSTSHHRGLNKKNSSESASEREDEQEPAKLTGIDNLERTLRKSIDTELALAESRLNFLATTGSTAPFVGLLGTVLGIMTSFSQIAASGSASLAVVAPGISEALFATAVGLFAALPAVAAYNYFVSIVRRLEMDMNSFGSDFLNIAKRNFFAE